MIALTQVPAEKSAQVEAYGYDSVQQVLRVKFRRGGAYDYKQVGPDAHTAFVAADSLGKHLGAHIKPHFDCEPVPTDDDAPITTTEGKTVDLAAPWQVPARSES